MEDFLKVIELYDIIIQANPNSYMAYEGRGVAKIGLSNYTGAIEDFDKSIELNPKYAEAYMNRGKAKFEIEDRDGAKMDWEIAGELGNIEGYNMIIDTILREK
jgi:tetratricopeptide (TPR) repeat protein